MSNPNLSSSDANFIGNYKNYILELADKHHVVYTRTAMDDLADKFTELSGDTVVLDDISNLLIALYRHKVITVQQMGQLHIGYLKEKKLGQQKN